MGGIGGCYCAELNPLLSRVGLVVRVPGVRCGICVEQTLEAKNELVRENNELRELLLQVRLASAAEYKRLLGVIEGLSGRVVVHGEGPPGRAQA